MDSTLTAGDITLGSLFLASYYAEFDYMTTTVSFAANSLTKAWTPTITAYTPPPTPTPTPTPSSGMAWWAVLLIVLACLLVLVLIALLVKHFKDKSNDESASIAYNSSTKKKLVTDEEGQNLSESLN